MTPQPIQQVNRSLDVELDQLTYSAYLLTLDPDLALSVVMAAIDGQWRVLLRTAICFNARSRFIGSVAARYLHYLGSGVHSP